MEAQSKTTLGQNIDPDETDETSFKWINLIFLPFNPVFKFLVLISVITKCLLGPLISLHNIMHCEAIMNDDILLSYIKVFYLYIADPIYCVDTFLHIVHRQVEDEARKREYIPKSALTIFLDILSLMPLFSLAGKELCHDAKVWPNILSFNEMLIIYQIGQYFSLNVTHSQWRLITGYIIIGALILNAISCFFLLLTFQGLCKQCKTYYYDWRAVIMRKGMQLRPRWFGWLVLCFSLAVALEFCLGSTFINGNESRPHSIHTERGVSATACEIDAYQFTSKLATMIQVWTQHNFTTKVSLYFYATVFVASFCLHYLFESTSPQNTAEFIIFSIFMLIGYLVWNNILVPRFFTENLLMNRRVFMFSPRVVRIIEETKRRSPSPSAYKEIEYFYTILWRKRNGIASMPEVLSELPMYLKTNVRQDLVWAVFHHSPVFRRTSSAYRRWLSEHISLEFKLPGERFFTGSNCFTNLYYIKSGVVQIYSADDCTSPILSVTGGTIFGDCSFILPPLNRKLIVRCITFCEVFVVSRTDVLTSLHKFPEDRRVIMKEVRGKVKHARGLFKCKQLTRGLDRSEDEGIAWLKKRWWEISAAIARYKRTKRENKCELPAEEKNYHCAKYIGQLVLGKEEQLRQTSMFVNVKFPYLLAPYTTLGYIWNLLIYIVVWLTIFLSPPNITKAVEGDEQLWFVQFRTFVDVLYLLDVVVSLITTVEGQDNLNTFSAILRYRLRSPCFFLDILSTALVDTLLKMILSEKYAYILNFNELLKTYMLFINRYERKWRKKKDPVKQLLYQITLVHLIYMYVFPFALYNLHVAIPQINASHYIIKTCEIQYNVKKCKNEFGIFSIVVGFNSFMYCFSKSIQNIDRSILETLMVAIFIFCNCAIYLYSRTTYIASLYLKNRETINYQYYVRNLKKYFIEHKLHPDLMNRLERHLTCHWKYFKGMDILYPNPLQDEPYDIYWRYQGEIAQKVISESSAFKGADPALIKDLVHKSKFLILPKNSTLVLFGLQIRTIMWLINGSVNCEYHNDDNELERRNYSPFRMLTFSSIFLDRAPLRTYTALSDCEILYIPYKDYASALYSYPDEKSFFEKCAKEIRPRYDDLLRTSLMKHKVYQKKLRDKILHGKKSSSIVRARRRIMGTDKQRSMLCQFFYEYRTKPESQFILYWMRFRIIVAILSIICATMPAILGYISAIFYICGVTCELIGLVDVLIKLFLPYYDERGLIISCKKKCIMHYLVRGFIIDVIANTDMSRIIVAYIDKQDQSLILLYRAITKSAQLYLFMGYMNYQSDMPTARSAVLMILKWQSVIVVAMILAGNFYAVKCIKFSWDDNYNLRLMKRPTCWLPRFFDVPKYPTKRHLRLVFSISLSLAQYGFLRTPISIWEVVAQENIIMCSVFLLMALVYWVCLCMCQIVTVLHYRGDTYFQQNLTHLKNYLVSERVEKHLIKRTVGHFEYWWQRTKGFNLHQLLTERIGVVFRQDLNYYFFKKTLEGVDSLLGGGEVLQRGLVGFVTQIYYLDKQEIMREKDLATSVYFVHRGKVSISKGGKKLADITKGSIFGQLDGKKSRPIRTTAITVENSDVLAISIHDFQQNITDKIRNNISSNPESKNDYLAVKSVIVDDPEATIQYMLREKVLKVPRIMNSPIEVEKKDWYFYWMLFQWFIGPVNSAFLVVMNDVVDEKTTKVLFIIMMILDCLYVGYLVLELFVMKLVVDKNKCVYKYSWLKKFTSIWLYVDVLSLIFPVVAYFTDDWRYNLGRLMRLHITIKFYNHYCKTVRTNTLSSIVKMVLILLLLHVLSCGWVSTICRRGLEDVIIPKLNASEYKHRDLTFWLQPGARNGCTRITTSVVNGTTIRSFLIPNNWVTDYVMAFFGMVTLLTGTNSVVMVPVTFISNCFKIVATFILCLLNLYICSLTLSNYYSKYRDKYHHDGQVADLLCCLKYNGLSNILLKSVQEYTEKSWQRQQGKSLPLIIKEAPLCLQQDIMSALFMHHLLTPPLFQYLPPFFLRQLVTRLKRIVVFPENRLIREGDIFPRIYFIHEGEVEKWYQDITGEVRMGTVLTTNGYFGLIPGIFPNTPYQFTYYSRTVVDLVFLDFNDWQDLLNGYPDIKRKLYTEARQAKINARKMTISN